MKTSLEIHPHDAEQRGISDGDWVGLMSRAGETVLRAQVTERVQPGVVYTTFHHPESGANVVTTDNSDWATNCPEYKVTAVQARKVTVLFRLAGKIPGFHQGTAGDAASGPRGQAGIGRWISQS